MIALKQAEIYELAPSSAMLGFSRNFLSYRENYPINSEPVHVLDEPKFQMQESIDNVDSSFLDKKSSRVLEQRLFVMRKELERQTREHNRLLNLSHSQADQLAIIEPLPRLFLTRLEDVLRVLEPSSKGSNDDEISYVPDELERRFNKAIAQLSLIFGRDQVIENRELKEALTKLQITLESKREEVLQLRVEQEQLNQKLIAAMEKVQRFDAEIAGRELRIVNLQKYVKESEAKHRQLFVDRRAMRNKQRSMSGAFTFAKNPLQVGQQSGWNVASIILGLILGCALTVAGIML